MHDRHSFYNSLFVATLTTVITVVLAFVFAYALQRSCMPFKGLFKSIAMVPILVPSLLPGIGLIYLFVNAMTTVSAVVFLYSTRTTLASVAVLNMDDAGQLPSAAAMGMMIFYTNLAARGLHRRTQAWRQR